MKIFDIFSKSVLVTRESVKLVESNLDNLLIIKGQAFTMDFEGIEAITPSFFDELLDLLERRFDGMRSLEVILENFPARLSPKYEAIGRGRAILITEPKPGRWTITKVIKESSAAHA